MEQVTIENLEEFGEVYKAIEWAQKQYGEYPKAPKRPVLQSKHTSEEAKNYVVLLEQYEKDDTEYKTQKDLWTTNKRKVNDVIEQFIKNQAGLDTVPEQYREKISAKAYADGHSNGYYEVFQHLCSLVDIFND